MSDIGSVCAKGQKQTHSTKKNWQSAGQVASFSQTAFPSWAMAARQEARGCRGAPQEGGGWEAGRAELQTAGEGTGSWLSS